MEKYLEHFPQDEMFCRQLMDMKERVTERYVPLLTDFLNPHERDVASSLIGKHQDVRIAFFGGIENAEMQRALLYHAMDSYSLADFQISVLALRYPHKFIHITHRDVLGALMNLGLKRELYGDIVVRDGEAYVACAKHVEDYLQTHLTTIGKGKVSISPASLPIARVEQFRKAQGTIASFRLDAILSEAFHLSRKEAMQRIQSNFVKVNYKEVVQTDFLCHNNDIISLRKHGRIKLVDLNYVNRKGKHVIEIWFYK